MFYSAPCFQFQCHYRKLANISSTLPIIIVVLASLYIYLSHLSVTDLSRILTLRVSLYSLLIFFQLVFISLFSSFFFKIRMLMLLLRVSNLSGLFFLLYCYTQHIKLSFHFSCWVAILAFGFIALYEDVRFVRSNCCFHLFKNVYLKYQIIICSKNTHKRFA